MARGGLRRAAGRGRRAPGRARSGDAVRARARGLAGSDALELGGARRASSESAAAGFQIPALGLVLLSEQESLRRASGDGSAGRRSSGAPPSPPSPTWRPMTSSSTRCTASRRYHGLAHARDGRARRRFPPARVRRRRPALPPVERLDLISKYMGAPDGAARLDRLGGVAWERVKDSVRAALRAMAEELLRLYAARSVVERSAFSGDSAVAGRIRGGLPLRGDARTRCGRSRTSRRDMDEPAPHGPARRGRRGLRQDRGGPARGVQGGGRRPPGRGAGADDGARAAALQYLQRAVRAVSRRAWSCSRASGAPRSRRRSSRDSRAAPWTS